MIATVHTPPSPAITESAVRLFRAGYAAKLTLTDSRDGVLIHTIPSETRPGLLYRLNYDIQRETLTCSCPAGEHGRACKHQRLYQLLHGWGIREEAAPAAPSPIAAVESGCTGRSQFYREEAA